MSTLLQRRFERTRESANDGLVSRLRLRFGTSADYAALAEHHYRAVRPATATRVLVWEDPTPTAAARFGNTDTDPAVVGVLVESLPALSCRMRDHALDHRYGPHLAPDERALLLNAEVRCISRVVIDPRYRGLGLAVKLVRAALDTATTSVTEALAAMGKVHPFFERSGMTAYPRPTHDYDARLLDALNHAGVEPGALADLTGTWQLIRALPRGRRRWLLRELRGWYRKNVGRAGGYDRNPRTHLRTVRKRLGLEPVYYVKVHGENTS